MFIEESLRRLKFFIVLTRYICDKLKFTQDAIRFIVSVYQGYRTNGKKLNIVASNEKERTLFIALHHLPSDFNWISMRLSQKIEINSVSFEMSRFL